MLTEFVRAMRAGDFTLASVAFFRPRPVFFEQMKAFRGLHLYDVGAGLGHVADGLAAHGHEVTALDLYIREQGSRFVELANGATYAYEPGGVVLICRPCHGPFTEAVIEQALACNVAWLVYVGLPKNREYDLGRYNRLFRRAVRRVGAQGESLYVMRAR